MFREKLLLPNVRGRNRTCTLNTHTILPTEFQVNFYQNKPRHISDAPAVMTKNFAISFASKNHMDSTDRLFEPDVFNFVCFGIIAAQTDRQTACRPQCISCCTNRKPGHYKNSHTHPTKITLHADDVTSARVQSFDMFDLHEVINHYYQNSQSPKQDLPSM